MLGDFLRGWNDAVDHESRQELKRYILPPYWDEQSGEDRGSGPRILADWVFREHLPLFLNALEDEEASRVRRGAQGASVNQR